MNKKSRWQQRLEDFEQAAKRLKEALTQTKFTELEQDGAIQRFEFTFELAWKTLKDYLENQGFTDISSPKKAIQKAFENNLIQKGDLWIAMQEDRNKMSHMYDQSTSKTIFNHIKKDYSKELNTLVSTLKKEIK